MRNFSRFFCFCNKTNNNKCVINTNKKVKKEIPLNLNFKELKKYVPYFTEARVIKVYDGDTIWVAAYDEVGKLHKYNVRINGIDCPELRSNNEKEKIVAELARDKLALMIYNNIVSIENINGLDKYGRLLCDVIYNDINVSKWMLEKRLAVKYDGGTKNTPECWLKYYNGK